MQAQNRYRWLSERAETLIGPYAPAPDADGCHCDVLIVGSGYGGAVAAARLAGSRSITDDRATRVFVLERGNEYLPGMFPSRFAQVPGHVRFSLQDGAPARGLPTALFDMRLGDDVNVLLASGLGGGSLINAAVMERPTADAFAAGWPPGIDLDALEPGYAAARDMLVLSDTDALPVRPPKFDALMSAGRLMQAEVRRAARFAIATADGSSGAGVPMRQCIECGDCVSGCNQQAKQSLDVNYLARAAALGARLFCGATVQRIARQDGAWQVHWALTDPATDYPDPLPFTLRARRVILAAGALGSTEILLRSADAGLPVSKTLGSRFSTNGDMIAAGWRQNQPAHASPQEGEPLAQRGVGPTICGLVRKQVSGRRPVVFEEFSIPAPLRRVLAEVLTTFGGVREMTRRDTSRHAPDETRIDPMAIDDDAIAHTSIYGMMGDDGAGGTLELMQRPARGEGPAACDGQVHIRFAAVRSHPVFRDQLQLLERAHSATGLQGHVLPNPMWQPLPPSLPLPPGPVMTVHPLGGCPMAGQSVDGVVDDRGRVFDPTTGQPHDGLVVLDGSIVPVALGINPSFTIAALSERAIGLLMSVDWQLRAATGPAPAPPPRPAWALAPATPPQPTAITLRERLSGTVHVNDGDLQAALTVAFDPVADLASFVRKLPRSATIGKAQLSLTDRGGTTWQADLRGSARILVRDRSAWWTRTDRTYDLALARIRQFLGAQADHMPGLTTVVWILSSHLGGRRLLEYDLRVERAEPGGPLRAGDRVVLRKTLAYTEDGNPWRQLSEGDLLVDRLGTHPLGRLALDLQYLVDQLTPLLKVTGQQDEPNAIGDLVELALFIVRAVLRIHLVNFLPPPGQDSKVDDRKPGTVLGIDPQPFPLTPRRPDPHHPDAAPAQLSRYRPATRAPGRRPVLMIHGFGASGSTFAHRFIPGNAVESALRAGLEVWVLDLKTSIALNNHHRYWPFEAIARTDIVEAVRMILALGRQERLPADPVDVLVADRVDVLAHCIGAAMFSSVVLDHPTLRQSIGAVVLSQVAPLVRMTPFNALRGYLAAYLKQYVQADEFDVQPPDQTLTLILLDCLLATFPYPDGDGERARREQVPGFALVRHRADAIFGQLMRLRQMGNDMLGALDAIYGWVSVRGLSQVIGFAARHMVTNAQGTNQWISIANLTRRFDFPLLLLHGQHNGVFDWRGAYDTWWLLKQLFEDDSPPPPRDPPVPNGKLILGQGTRRQLLLLADYGHQDCMIGAQVGRDVFPPVLDFLAAADTLPAPTPKPAPGLVADVPWIGPILGGASIDRVDRILTCRLAIAHSPARATFYGLVLVPVGLDGRPLPDQSVQAPMDVADLVQQALVVQLRMDGIDQYAGFVVLTLHDPLPLVGDGAGTPGDERSTGLFAVPTNAPSAAARAAVEKALRAPLALATVGLTPSWIAAADLRQDDGDPPTPGLAADHLRFALGSCQYPAGLLDDAPAQAAYARLAGRLHDAPADRRPQLLLLVGDQVYVDETAGLFQNTADDDAYQRPYDLNLRMDAFRAVARALPVYPLLDDHEVIDNWEPGRPLPADRGHAALRAYRHRMHKVTPPSTMAEFSYRIAPAGFPMFFLDTRTTRHSRSLSLPAVAAGQPLPPPRQPAALDDALICDLATGKALLDWLRHAPVDLPKFIVSPVPVLPLRQAAVFGNAASRIALDDWGGFPAALVPLLRTIRDRRIANVVFVSGDAHISCATSLRFDPPADGVVVHSIVSSGLYIPWPFTNGRADQFVLDGCWTLAHRGRTIGGLQHTAAFLEEGGFAQVEVMRDASGWQLAVEFDLTSGVQRYQRSMAADGQWRRCPPPKPKS